MTEERPIRFDPDRYPRLHELLENDEAAITELRDWTVDVASEALRDAITRSTWLVGTEPVDAEYREVSRR